MTILLSLDPRNTGCEKYHALVIFVQHYEFCSLDKVFVFVIISNKHYCCVRHRVSVQCLRGHEKASYSQEWILSYVCRCLFSLIFNRVV